MSQSSSQPATDSAALSKHAGLAERIIGGVVAAGTPAVSPDGRWIAFVVARTDFAKNRGRAQVWLAAADDSTPARPLSAGDNTDSQPAWSPDGRSLAFTSSRSETKGEATLHVLAMDGPGELRTIATMKDSVGHPTWSPDGTWIAFTSHTLDTRYDAEDESWQAPRKIERFFTRMNGQGWVFDRPSHVYVVPANGTAAPHNLTPGPFQHEGVAWLTDSSAIITATSRHETWDRDLVTDLYRIPLDGTDITPLTRRTGSYFSPAVSPDGTRVAFLGHDDPMTDPQNVHVGVVTLANGEIEWASKGLDRTFSSTAGAASPVWLDDAWLLASADDRGRCHVYAVAADATSAPVARTEGQRWVRSFDAKNGTLAAAISCVDRPAELFSVIDGVERQLTRLSDPYVANVKPQPWERFTVPTTDGTHDIDAWLMLPVGFDETQRYPLILNVHGGPHTQYGETYFDEAQFQAAAGFVVLMCNPRGSSGREQAWGQAIMGPKHPVAPGTGWGGADLDDVLAVLDHALAHHSFCDPDRIGMQGGSYGGYMATLLAGTNGHRFRGICSERAVNNLLSQEWSSDIGSVFRTVASTVNHIEDPAEYERMSPMRWVRDIHVPMLIIHSEQDLRCPVAQAEELFMALRILEREVTFYRFPGENHELSRSGSPVHRRQRAEIILDWFADKLAAR